MVDGIVLVDKPPAWTSHDVVARIRRLAGTRKVGHAGTLDPMATGVLVLGVGRATRLLTYLVGADKTYLATVRLGVSTLTDDADGEVLAATDASGVSVARLDEAVAGLTGAIEQRPSAVSAIKVDGRRSYARVRAGEQVSLAARPVTVSRFDVLGRQERTVTVHLPETAPDDPGRSVAVLDVDIEVDVSSGTYVRALARDLGEALGVGGHLVALRRTRVGPYDVGRARTLDELTEDYRVMPLAEAARAVFPARELDESQVRTVRFGQRLSASGRGPEPVAAFGPDGALVALLQDRDGSARSLFVVAPSDPAGQRA